MRQVSSLAFLLVIKIVGARDLLGNNSLPDSKAPYPTAPPWSPTAPPPPTPTNPQEDCPTGWVDSAEGCYLFQYTKSITWRAAQDDCESLGGFLAEVKTEEQARFLVRN